MKRLKFSFPARNRKRLHASIAVAIANVRKFLLLLTDHTNAHAFNDALCST